MRIEGGRCGAGTVLALVSAVIAWSGAPGRAAATIYHITALADGVAADGECRLREAIRAAKTDLAVNECAAGGEADTIVLATTGTYLFDQGEESLSYRALAIRGATGSPENHVIDLADQNRFLSWIGSESLVLENLTLRDGNALGTASGEGGALHLFGGTVLLRNLVVQGCRAARGGGLDLGLGDGLVADVTLEGVRFVDNIASGGLLPRGGAMHVYLLESGALRVRGSLFSGNRAESAAPGAFAQGGGLAVTSFPGPMTVEVVATTFEANLALAPNGGSGGAAALVGSAGNTVRVSDSTFSGNGGTDSAPGHLAQTLDLAGSGDASLELRRLRIEGDGSPASTEAQVVLSALGTSSLLLESSLVTNGSGPGIRVETGEAARLTLSQNTVASNESTGVVARGNSTLPLRIEGSVLWGNGAVNDDLDELGLVDADRAANHNWIGDQGDPDPLFVNPPSGDFRLQALSGAVDAGDATFVGIGPFDLDHAPRVTGLEIDLGAFERDGLFADGFESGWTGSWSTAAP